MRLITANMLITFPFEDSYDQVEFPVPVTSLPFEALNVVAAVSGETLSEDFDYADHLARTSWVLDLRESKAYGYVNLPESVLEFVGDLSADDAVRLMKVALRMKRVIN